MSDLRNPFSKFLGRPNEDPVKILGVAAAVAVVCALVVSTAAVTLKPRQEAHLQAERDARMAAMLDTLPGMADILRDSGADSLETRLVDLATGAYADAPDPASYDMQAAAADPATAVPIPSETDVATLRQRAPFAPVHILQSGGQVRLVILPVQGQGYQSTIRALLALNADLETVAALTITEQGETPGLGARIEEPDWQAQWPGVRITNDAGEIAVSVVKGGATEPYEVDGISGATRTSNGVGTMLQYWLGPHGYGPFLDRLREGGA